MTVYINGKPLETEAASVAELRLALGLPETVAIAINNCVVPRAEWEKRTLAEGDKLIIIRAVCGG